MPPPAPMPSPKLRKITVEGERYLVRLEVEYLGVRTPVLRARTTFIAYLEGHKASPARLCFATLADAQAGAPLNSGYAFELEDGQTLRLNLNEPRHAASMIRLLRALGWDPAKREAFVVEDGNRYLAKLAQATL